MDCYVNGVLFGLSWVYFRIKWFECIFIERTNSDSVVKRQIFYGEIDLELTAQEVRYST